MIVGVFFNLTAHHVRMLDCVCHSHLPPPCLSKAELLTQCTEPLFMDPLWSLCRSRSLGLMLSVNEVAHIVPGAKKGRHGPRTALEGSSSSSPAAALAFLPPCNRKPASHAYFQLCLRFLGQRRKGEGCTGRHCQEVACPFTVISANAVLSYLHQIYGCFVVVVIWQQLLK